ncbi:hypothetical protein H6P81_018114 [Aristolochia fimbriata]|uniref:PHD-type domain-containing protein n=1 Tax=Aristolochia fimbriata TaxID=158543 RepID=A0AAV7E024_ARIFI|nr:hypothetical protein H6P81_018114 [Aristolochia fimbriata]
MANGTSESDDFVLRSGPRSGLKREFAFALKSHSQFSESIGRTRSGKKRLRVVSPKRVSKEGSRLETPILVDDDEKSGVDRAGAVVGASERRAEADLDVRGGDVLGGDVRDLDVSAVEMTAQVVQEVVLSVPESVMETAAGCGIRQTKPVVFSYENSTEVLIDENGICTTAEDGPVAPVSLPEKRVKTETVEEEPVEVPVVESISPVEEFAGGTETVSNTGDETEAVGNRAEGAARLEDELTDRTDEHSIVEVSVHQNAKDVVVVEASEGATAAQVSSTIPNVAPTDDRIGKTEENAEANLTSSDEKSAATVTVTSGGTDTNKMTSAEHKSPLKTPPMHTVYQRRFTRSLLKDKAKPVEPVAITSGEDSALLDSSKSEGTSETGELKLVDESNQINSATSKKLELKMSKKIVLDKFPSTIKELLATGLLEGLPVKYLDKNGALPGTIQGCGILCSCSACNGMKVVSPYQFEKHAGSLKKRSAEYIYLENGRTVRDILNVCNNAPLDMLEATIQGAISSTSVERMKKCQSCKEYIKLAEARTSMPLCSRCLGSKRPESTPVRVSSGLAGLSKPVMVPKTPVSTSKHTPPPKKAAQGRVTKKDLGLHKLVFTENGLPNGTEVAYYARGQRLLEGYKTINGIFCRCCNKEVSPSQFEAHAGWASRRKPYLNIYTSNGVSLHELSLSLSKGRKHSTVDNDDLCSICFDGGNLLLCDLCPRAFHPDCVGLSTIPRGKWYCRYCFNMLQREKFVEHNVNAIAAGRISGVDPIEQISTRSIRLVKVKTQEADVSCCVLCRCHDFSKSGFGPRTVLLCDQCEKEYHVGCLREHNMGDLKELPQGNWFCCGDCSEIHTALEALILSGPEELPVPVLDALKAKHEMNPDNSPDYDVRWRLLRGKLASPETRPLLSKAVGIFHDRFDPIHDSTTGRDLIPSMVYGRNMRDQEFGGMYCAVLTVNSSVVSAGILRIFGQDVAEIPLVATSIENQGQGYFQSLFGCIERLLGLLNVKNLVLPAADEAESIWTKKFGFEKITAEQLCNFTRDSHLMTFQGTSMLHKVVVRGDDHVK